jgi:hypothetical protein
MLSLCFSYVDVKIFNRKIGLVRYLVMNLGWADVKHLGLNPI